MFYQNKLLKSLILIVLSCLCNLVNAQIMGTYRLNLSPFCNVVTLTVTQFEAGISAVGSEDCGTNRPIAVSGSFIKQPDNISAGIITGTITTTSYEGHTFVTRLIINENNGSSTWNDNSGNSGEIIFNPDDGVYRNIPRQNRPELWVYVNADGLIEDSSANSPYDYDNMVIVNHPATGIYCVSTVRERRSILGVQATLARPQSNNIISIGVAQGNPLCGDLSAYDKIQVYIVKPNGELIDDSFTLFIPNNIRPIVKY